MSCSSSLCSHTWTEPSTELPRLLATAACAVLTLVVAPAASAQSPGLFIPLELERSATAAVAGESVRNVAKRERLVTIDFAALERVRASLSQPAAVPAALTLNLFEDTTYEVVVERTEPTFSGGYSIAARIVGEPLGRATLVVNGMTVAGTVRTIGGTWRIRPAGNGRVAVGEVDASKLPPLCAVEDVHERGVRSSVEPW